MVLSVSGASQWVQESWWDRWWELKLGRAFLGDLKCQKSGSTAGVDDRLRKMKTKPDVFFSLYSF